LTSSVSEQTEWVHVHAAGERQRKIAQEESRIGALDAALALTLI